jgi:flagellar basal body-associated protein FliL
MSGQDDVGTSTVALIGFLGALVLFVIIVLLQAIFYHVSAEQRAQDWESETPVPLNELRAKQEKLLNEYQTDPQTHAVRIPIARAMDLVVKETLEGVRKKPPQGAEPPAKTLPVKKADAAPAKKANTAETGDPSHAK